MVEEAEGRGQAKVYAVDRTGFAFQALATLPRQGRAGQKEPLPGLESGQALYWRLPKVMYWFVLLLAQ